MRKATMSGFCGSLARTLAGLFVLTASSTLHLSAHGYTPLGGFIPFVGIGMTNESKTLDDLDLGSIPFIADAEYSVGAPLLGAGGTPHFEMALLDTGAATHIITHEAFLGFDIEGAGLRGENIQQIGGATGFVDLEINDAAGIYTAGLGDRTGAGAKLTMNANAMRGQSSFATLTAPEEEWKLPNILGLPMAAHHAISIRNDQPQIFQHQGRTVRSPNVKFIDLGTGASEGISRRAPLILNPGIGFIQGPQYVFNLGIDDIFTGGGEIAINDNPASPSVVQDTNGNGGGLYLDVDMANGTRSFEDRKMLFDTGADLTVVSQITAARLGFDAVLDKPDFVLEVEGSGGVSTGVPGFYVDELNIDTVGGTFTLQNVPIAVLDVTNPNDPGNVIDGIIGMHLFTGRNLVIDANPSRGQGGVGPSLYIGNPVSQTANWASNAASSNWATNGSWSLPGAPTQMWDAQVRNVSNSNQTAIISSNSTVYRATVAGAATASMTLAIQTGATLTTFGEISVESNGRLQLQGGKVDAQFINIDGGTLAGSGDVFVGTGPITGAVRNISGRIEPGAPVGKLTITGDLSHLNEGTLAIDLGGTTAVTQYDQISVDRYAFLGGTLEVSLANLGGLFAPAVGNVFTIITAGEGVVGEFDNLILPGGYQWQVNYQDNAVLLQVTGLAALAGDFNADGSVNAADLVAWKQSFGTIYDGSDFLAWQRSMAAATGAAAAVPEPAAGGLMIVAAATLAAARRRRSI